MDEIQSAFWRKLIKNAEFCFLTRYVFLVYQETTLTNNWNFKPHITFHDGKSVDGHLDGRNTTGNFAEGHIPNEEKARIFALFSHFRTIEQPRFLDFKTWLKAGARERHVDVVTLTDTFPARGFWKLKSCVLYHFRSMSIELPTLENFFTEQSEQTQPLNMQDLLLDCRG